MNVVIMIGRLVKDPEVRYTSSGDAVAIYRLAVDRPKRRDAKDEADFFNCVAFGRGAEFAERYLKQGTKIAIDGRIQNNNYKDKDGRTVYSNQIIVDHHEFVERKGGGKEESKEDYKPEEKADKDGFMNIPDGIDEELPFN